MTHRYCLALMAVKMNKVQYKDWNILIAPQIDQPQAERIFDVIQNTDFRIKSVLKDNHRSSVNRIEIGDRDLVFKIPKEKNTRYWIRFLTWFRMGEAFKNLHSMNTLSEIGINTTTPVLAAERRKFGMVVDSWLVYEYLDGISCLDRPDTYERVIVTLSKIHNHYLLHGDPQIRNFIEKNDDIYVIDANPTKAGITWFDYGYEWAYLRKSAPGIEKLFGKISDSFWYKFAFRYDLFNQRFSRFRKKIKSIFN